MVNKCVKATEGRMPLSAYAENGFFKLYMMDTGLLCSKFDIAPHVVLGGAPPLTASRGPWRRTM